MATQLGARALQGGCKLPGLRVSRVAFDSQGSGVVERVYALVLSVLTLWVLQRVSELRLPYFGFPLGPGYLILAILVTPHRSEVVSVGSGLRLGSSCVYRNGSLWSHPLQPTVAKLP